MVFKKNLIRFVLTLLLFCPLQVFAHLISIQTTTPFPQQIAPSATATALYTVTNISKIPVTVIDQSQFPSSLSISASTCGNLMSPGTSCSISVTLTAPNSETTIHSALKEWAKPSIDGVQVPISVQVVSPSIPTYTVTPTAGVGGSISPNTPQTVNSGGDLTFTATPTSGFSVDQWSVDGLVVQTGGTSFSLTNITANHAVSVSFMTSAPVLSIAGGRNGVTGKPLIIQSSDNGTTWSAQDTSLPTGGTYRGAACTGTGSTARCIFGGDYISGGQNPSYAYTQDGGTTWNSVFYSSLNNRFLGAGATGTGSNAVLMLVGESLARYRYSSDGGNTFSADATLSGATGTLQHVSCTDSQPNALCVVGGIGTTLNANQLFAVLQINGGITDSYPAISGFTASAEVSGISCTGTGSNVRCAIVGNESLLAVTADRGVTWSAKTAAGMPTPARFNSVSCTSSGATAFCVAAGQDSNTFEPFIIQSTDGGNTWSLITVAGLSTSASLNSVSCSGSSCAIAGFDGSSQLIIATINQGSTWDIKSISGTAPPADRFNSVTCSGNSPIVCTAIGPEVTGTPFLATSKDGGLTWSYQTVTNMPATANLVTSAGTN